LKKSVTPLIATTHRVCNYWGWPSLLIATKQRATWKCDRARWWINGGGYCTGLVCLRLAPYWLINWFPFLYDSTIYVFGCESSNLLMGRLYCHYTDPPPHNNFIRSMAFRLHRSSTMLILHILWFWFRVFFSFSILFLIFGWNKPLEIF